MAHIRAQELCESRGGRPGRSVLMSLTVSVDVKQHWTVLRSQFVPNMSTDIRGHEALFHHGSHHCPSNCNKAGDDGDVELHVLGCRLT